ncbi:MULTISPECIES: major capsid protein [unclassified Streptomyces]|uniref:major capsid protein n=1 Tax=unclassified Streptomyces TaxID=2593676 RepID=UPI00087E5F50|nr:MULTISPECIES: major capsid protein [unclassified Streptomyces]PBC72253.1 major capsid protein E [Streptomyces sp. 2321.6]SDR61958.1 Phage major capsid protein E [Streptomyces sp. KS_16]SEE49154.1 Phage major capsid protein E [Streptomyces sp. 2133.1]SNC77758.1 Phage major capsid protein E [Streptomyces sp. 2114.4]
MEALELLLQDTSATDLTVFARQLDTPAKYRLTREVLPPRTIQGIRFKAESMKRRVNAAKFRAYDAPTAMAQRQAERVVNEGMLPALGQTLAVSEMDQILLDVGSGQDTARYIDLLYSDVERHVESIQTAQELAAGQLLANGTVNLPGIGLDINWNVPSANMPTAAVKWDQPSATPLADERAWIDYLVNSGAPTPKMVLTSRRARSILASNAEYRAAFYGSYSTETTPTATLAPNDVDTVRARYGLPPIVEYDVQVWDDDVYKRVIPDTKWILVPDVSPAEWAETQWGRTREAAQFTSGTNPALTREEAPGIVVVTHVDDNPVQIYTRGAAVGMPVLYVPDIHISATVL